MHKVLIVNPFGIGDVLFTTPMIAALRGNFPGISVSYLASGRAAPFLKNDPRLEKVFSYDRDEFVAVYRKSPWQFLLKWKRFIDDIQVEKFDVVFDLSLNSGIGLALQLAGIPQRIGYDYKGRGRFLTDVLPLKGYGGQHVVEHHFELLRFLGISDEPGRMTFFLSPDDEAWADRFLTESGIVSGYAPVGFFPGGGASWGKNALVRRWDEDHHAKLAEKIVEKASCPIILMGDKNDLQICVSVAGKMSHKPVVASGKTSLGTLAALMKRCRFLVMNDGGAMHIAAALNVPAVVIFGPVDEFTYGPFPVSDQIIAAKEIFCRPCYRNFRMSSCAHLSCLKTLTVEEVYRKVESLL